MKCGDQAPVDPKPVAQPVPEHGSELGSAVRGDRLGQAVEAKDVLDR